VSGGILHKYDSQNRERWSESLGTSINRVSADGTGRIFATGLSHGDDFIASFWESPTGDFNRDGIVDAADYPVWRHRLFDIVAACSGPDADCDAFVNGPDYDLWREYFGETFHRSIAASFAANAQAAEIIPEPSITALIAAGLIGSVVRGNRLARSSGFCNSQISARQIGA
jgi:hypothetical protein